MSGPTTFLAVAAMTGGLLIGQVAAAEKTITMAQLPASVQKAANENLQGGVIKAASKETEMGQTFYEVETVRAGHTRDLLFDASGQLVSVEEEMAPDAVPAPVRTTLATYGTILKVESVTKGSTVTYEGLVHRGGKRSELMVDGDGKLIKP